MNAAPPMDGTDPKDVNALPDLASFPSSLDPAPDSGFETPQSSNICFPLSLDHPNAYGIQSSGLFKEEPIASTALNLNADNLMIEVDEIPFSQNDKDFARDVSSQVATHRIGLTAQQDIQDPIGDPTSSSSQFESHHPPKSILEHNFTERDHEQGRRQHHDPNHEYEYKHEFAQECIQEQEQGQAVSNPGQLSLDLASQYSSHVQQQQEHPQGPQLSQMQAPYPLSKMHFSTDLSFHQFQPVLSNQERSNPMEAEPGYVIRTCRGLAEHKPGCNCKPCRGKRGRGEKPGWPDDVRPPNGRLLLFKKESKSENAPERPKESLTFSAARNLCKAIRRRESESSERNKRARGTLSSNSVQDYVQNCL